MENGQALENSLGTLRATCARRPVHDADTRQEQRLGGFRDRHRAHGGLTAFGVKVVHEMNRLGMLVDISHVSPEVMRQVLEVI